MYQEVAEDDVGQSGGEAAPAVSAELAVDEKTSWPGELVPAEEPYELAVDGKTLWPGELVPAEIPYELVVDGKRSQSG